jgi:ubiquinone biosynthesis protein UbiJ
MMDQFPRLSAVLARTVEEAANRLLDLDPDTAEKMTELDGRLVALKLEGPDITLYLKPRDGRLHVTDTVEGEPETTIRGTPGALFASAVSEEGRRTAGRIHIEGDAYLGQAMERLVRRLKPDWEEPLARAFGDVVGPRMARTLREGAAWGQAAGWSLAEQLTEYLRDERRHLVTRAEMESFIDEVDRLREAVDRLEARLRRVTPDTGSKE